MIKSYASAGIEHATSCLPGDLTTTPPEALITQNHT
jgi:hypothetical protein